LNTLLALLIEKGADVNAVSCRSRPGSPRRLWRSSGGVLYNTEGVKILLAHGADPVGQTVRPRSSAGSPLTPVQALTACLHRMAGGAGQVSSPPTSRAIAPATRPAAGGRRLLSQRSLKVGGAARDGRHRSGGPVGRRRKRWWWASQPPEAASRPARPGNSVYDTTATWLEENDAWPLADPGRLPTSTPEPRRMPTWPAICRRRDRSGGAAAGYAGARPTPTPTRSPWSPRCSIGHLTVAAKITPYVGDATMPRPSNATRR
jgi:hypothetical protein